MSKAKPKFFAISVLPPRQLEKQKRAKAECFAKLAHTLAFNKVCLKGYRFEELPEEEPTRIGEGLEAAPRIAGCLPPRNLAPCLGGAVSDVSRSVEFERGRLTLSSLRFLRGSCLTE